MLEGGVPRRFSSDGFSFFRVHQRRLGVHFWQGCHVPHVHLHSAESPRSVADFKHAAAYLADTTAFVCKIEIQDGVRKVVYSYLVL